MPGSHSDPQRPDTRPQARRLRSLRGAFSTLSMRVFLWLTGIIIAAFTAYAYFSVRTTAEHWRESARKVAQRKALVIQSSTHYSMLLNRKDDVRQIIRTLGQAPGVVGVRIFDKQGVIISSSDDAEIGHQVDLKAEACVICHDQEHPLQSVPTEDRVRVYRDPRGERVLGLIDPIDNEPACSDAACHAHPPEQTILGVLDVRLSMADAEQYLTVATNRIIIAAVVTTLLVGIFSATFINLMVGRPVRQLIEGTARIASGDLETRIAVGGRGEIRQLARAFNAMTRDLRRAREENLEWSRTLEGKIVEKTQELGRTQRQVVHMEKMASLGQLAATVAHELNNPLAGILNYARLVERDMADGGASTHEDDVRYLGLIRKEATRCGEIVRNLLLFSRQDEVRLAPHSLNNVVERALMLVHHHLEIAGMGLETDLLTGDDQIVCDADQIQQALVALFVNAVEARGDEPATLRVAVEAVAAAGGAAEAQLRLTVSDNGVGIAAETLPLIFEPFFSTKQKDQATGAGLGLSVAYGIVQRHGGTIEVQSEVGRGTTFQILLPRQPSGAGSKVLAEATAEA